MNDTRITRVTRDDCCCSMGIGVKLSDGTSRRFRLAPTNPDGGVRICDVQDFRYDGEKELAEEALRLLLAGAGERK